MISALISIENEEYTVDWPEPSVDLFHQINRIIDLGDGGKQQTIYFSRRHFREIRGWLTDYPHLSVSYLESWTITIVLDGYTLTLKVNENE